jgi:hypothetical protein
VGRNTRRVFDQWVPGKELFITHHTIVFSRCPQGVRKTAAGQPPAAVTWLRWLVVFLPGPVREVAGRLYSANRFVIFYSRQGSLEPLRALSATSLAALTSLKLVLRESSCHQPTDSSS